MKQKFIEIYRGIVVILMLTLFGLGGMFISNVIFLIKKERDERYKILRKSWEFFVYLLEKTTLLKLHIKDRDIIENIRGKIIVSTHPSFVDIVLLMTVVPQSTCFVADKLARNPFLKGMVQSLFIIEGEEAWLQKAEDALNSNFNVIVFPMGTRHHKDEHLRIRRGTALLALRTKKNISVLHLENSFDFLQIHTPVYKAGCDVTQYNLEYIGEINTQEYIDNYPDEVTFKTEMAKQIEKMVYKIQ